MARTNQHTSASPDQSARRVRPFSDSDRVRMEIEHDPQQRVRQIGSICHRSLAILAGLERPVTADDIDDTCTAVLDQRPVNAPKHMSRPLNQITGSVNAGAALLPPFSWRLIASELRLTSTRDGRGSFVDQVFETEDPVIVGDHLGDILGIEIKLGASTDSATLPDTRAQVAGYLDDLNDQFPARVLGVATILLGQPSSSLLTLADTAHTEIPLEHTDLWTFPTGRRA